MENTGLDKKSKMKKLLLIISLVSLCSCSNSYYQAVSYNKNGRLKKVKGCKIKIEHPKPEWRNGY
jgi:hypothetical protein